MTKKDYILIAGILRYYKVRADIGNEKDRHTIKQMVEDFAKELSLENPRFDLDKFLKACDY